MATISKEALDLISEIASNMAIPLNEQGLPMDYWDCLKIKEKAVDMWEAKSELTAWRVVEAMYHHSGFDIRPGEDGDGQKEWIASRL